MTGAILGVEHSVTGKRWRARLEDDRAAMALAQQLDLPEALARVLAARKVAPEDVSNFLQPSLKAFLPDPSVLKGMDEAITRLADAVEAGETVTEGPYVAETFEVTIDDDYIVLEV